MIPSDKEILQMIREGHNTVPRMAKHILGLPNDRPIMSLDFDTYHEYKTTLDRLWRRMSTLSKFREVTVVGIECGQGHGAKVWEVVEG